MISDRDNFSAGLVSNVDVSFPSRRETTPFRYVLGMRVDGTSYEEATTSILHWAKLRESRYVCEAPVHMVMESSDSAGYRAIINGADLVTPGGMPIVWMLRALGLAGQPRVYGPRLTLKVCEAATAAGIAVGFYGGTPRAVASLVRVLDRGLSGTAGGLRAFPAVSAAD